MPIGFESDDLSAPLLDLFVELSSEKPNCSTNFVFNFVYVNPDLKIAYFIFDIEKETSNPGLFIGGGIEALSTVVSDGSKYDNSIYDHMMGGLKFYLRYLHVKNHHFTFQTIVRTRTDTYIAKVEDQDTKLSHDWDLILKLGAKSYWSNWLTFAEITSFNFSEAKILSKDFSLVLDDSEVVRLGVGGGYLYQKYEIWLKIFRYTQPEDEIAHMYQATSFAPDYLLAKESMQLEVIWNF